MKPLTSDINGRNDAAGRPMSGWQLSGDAPALYNQFAIRAMEQWIDDLIRQANCKDGERVLDVACGTGFVTLRVEEVSGADCQLTGLDVNEGMLNAARKNPGVDWRLGSATAMPFPDSSFDVVLCQQGLQYFPDRQAAMKEIARVLVPGGRVSLNVWGRIERQAFFEVFVDACAEILGPETRSLFDLNFSLNTSEELHRLASGAGLKGAKVRFEHKTMRAPNASEYGIGFAQASPVAGQFLALSEGEQGRFGELIAERLASYIDDAGMAVPQENHFLLAYR